jgi:hypothetical protein
MDIQSVKSLRRIRFVQQALLAQVKKVDPGRAVTLEGVIKK